MGYASGAELYASIAPNSTLLPVGDARESAVCRMIYRVERLLMDSGKFRLPGKKQLYQDTYKWDVIVVNATESPPIAPKKT